MLKYQLIFTGKEKDIDVMECIYRSSMFSSTVDATIVHYSLGECTDDACRFPKDLARDFL